MHSEAASLEPGLMGVGKRLERAPEPAKHIPTEGAAKPREKYAAEKARFFGNLMILRQRLQMAEKFFSEALGDFLSRSGSGGEKDRAILGAFDQEMTRWNDAREEIKRQEKELMRSALAEGWLAELTLTPRAKHVGRITQEVEPLRLTDRELMHAQAKAALTILSEAQSAASAVTPNLEQSPTSLKTWIGKMLIGLEAARSIAEESDDLSELEPLMVALKGKLEEIKLKEQIEKTDVEAAGLILADARASINCLEALKENIFLHRNLYPKILGFIRSWKKIQAGSGRAKLREMVGASSYEQSYSRVASGQSLDSRSPILGVGYDRFRNSDAELKKLLDHDVTAMATAVSVNFDYLATQAGVAGEGAGLLDETELNAAKSLARIWPVLNLIFQDVLRQRLETAFGRAGLDFDQGQFMGELNVRTAERALTYFTHSRAAEGRVQQLVGEPSDAAMKAGARKTFFPYIKDKVIFTDAAVLLNGLMQILANACKTKIDASRVEFNINMSPDRQKLIITIADNGIGMDEEMLARIFDRGVSGTDSSGLGLADLDKRLETAGAKISVVSKPRSGSQEGFSTIFTIEVPLMPAKGEK